MAEWAEDAQYFEHSSKLLADGSAQIRERHVARFKEPTLRGVLVGRTVIGNVVIDHEEVTRTFSEGTGKIDVVAIDEVREGLIARAWFIPGTKVLDASGSR